ncbi:MAG: hypothetical protein RL757_211 [Bacteroidota bacterium]
MKKLIFSAILALVLPMMANAQTAKDAKKAVKKETKKVARKDRKGVEAAPVGAASMGAEPVNKEVVKAAPVPPMPAPVEAPPMPEPAPKPKIEMVFEKTAINENKKGPILTFETKSHDFGQVKTGDKPSFTFNFTNTGDEALDIDIVSGCDCTEIETAPLHVEPGGKGSIKATFNTTKAEHDEHKRSLSKDITVVLKQLHPVSGYPLVSELKFTVFIVD